MTERTEFRSIDEFKAYFFPKDYADRKWHEKYDKKEKRWLK